MHTRSFIPSRELCIYTLKERERERKEKNENRNEDNIQQTEGLIDIGHRRSPRERSPSRLGARPRP